MCSNIDPWLTLTYLTSRSNFHPNAFKWGKYWSPINILNIVFSETTKPIELKFYMETPWVEGS